MKTCQMLSPQFAQLHKTTSLPSFQREHRHDTNLSPVTSSSSCESIEEGYWRSTCKWILKLRKKPSISKSTIYLAISYLNRLIKHGYQLTQENYEKVGAALILLSAKMNQIYPPKMSSLLSRCSRPFTKDEITALQGVILQDFNYDMSFTQITYSYLAQILEHESQTKLDDAEKLLGLAVTQRQIMKTGEQTISLAIVYLIKPFLIRSMNNENLMRIKSVANKIYNLYILNKSSKN